MSNMENIDTTSMNMTREDLDSKLRNLKNLNMFNSKRLENYEQQLYEIKRQLSTSKVRKEHLSSEFESLQNANLSNTDTLAKKIEAYAGEILLLNDTNSENVISYKSQLQENDVEIGAIKKKINSESTTADDVEKITQYADTIFELKSKIEQLTLTIANNEIKCTEVIHKNELLENTFTELSSNILELKDCTNSKRLELQENSDLTHNLQDELIVLQMELKKFKNVSLDKTENLNSIFAEVDDNRLKLKRHIEISNKKYMDIKLKYNNKTQELQRLHSEYASLTKMKENKNNLQDAQCQLLEAYKRHFNNLTVIIKILEKELELRNLTSKQIILEEMDCAEELIPITRKEILNLQKEVNVESLARIISEQSLCETKREIRKWQIEAAQLRAKEVMLNQTIEGLKIKKGLLQKNDSEDDTNIFGTEVKKEVDECFKDNTVLREKSITQEHI